MNGQHSLEAKLWLDLQKSQIEPPKVCPEKDEWDGAERSAKDQCCCRCCAAEEKWQMLRNKILC